jgi:hypothetical protein
MTGEEFADRMEEITITADHKRREEWSRNTLAITEIDEWERREKIKAQSERRQFISKIIK